MWTHNGGRVCILAVGQSRREAHAEDLPPIAHAAHIVGITLTTMARPEVLVGGLILRYEIAVQAPKTAHEPAHVRVR